MKIAIIGNGWIGNMLKDYLKAEILPIRIEEIQEPLTGYDVVINASGKTAIDWCEVNKMGTFESNVLASVHLARMVPGKLVHFSSACVFESRTPDDVKDENSIPNPQCFYAETKLMAERLILEIKPDTLIIRPRLLLSEVPHPRNTLDKLLKYSRVIDSLESVTVVEDMLPLIKQLIEEKASGVFHVVNEGLIRPSEIMTLYGSTFETIPKETLDKELATQGKARRTSVSIVSNRIKPLPEIKARIIEVIKKHKELSK